MKRSRLLPLAVGLLGVAHVGWSAEVAPSPAKPPTRRSRRGVPRGRLGHRLRGRPAHQDVHRHHRRGLHRHPPRARPQLLPTGLRQAAGALPRQRQRWLPRGDRGHYNAAWWELRRKYQGVAPPSVRTEEDFDPAAKYHVAANVPYTRYFLADILQFQFHRALAKTAGCTAPLHRRSIYENREAGKRLADMLAMGSSKAWPEALQAWLDEQNRGKPVGW